MDGEWRYYGQAQVCSEDRQGSSATPQTTLIADLGLSIHVPMFMLIVGALVTWAIYTQGQLLL